MGAHKQTIEWHDFAGMRGQISVTGDKGESRDEVMKEAVRFAKRAGWPGLRRWWQFWRWSEPSYSHLKPYVQPAQAPTRTVRTCYGGLYADEPGGPRTLHEIWWEDEHGPISYSDMCAANRARLADGGKWSKGVLIPDVKKA